MTEKLLTVYATTQLIKKEKKKLFKLYFVFLLLSNTSDQLPMPWISTHINHSLIYPDFLKCRLWSKFYLFSVVLK